jgi:nicotinamide phosphoribosyltransferase
MKINPLTQLDFYKTDHRRQYPQGTELVYSNFTPRSVKHAAKATGVDEKIVSVGLQAYIKDLVKNFDEGFFKLPKAQVVGAYKRRMDTSLGVGAVPVDHIEALHDLGYLPLSVRALPEGSAVNARVPLFTIENTKPEFFWLTNYLETNISNSIWKTCTSATTAYKYKQLLTRYAKETGGDVNFVPFQAHDFSFRGMNGAFDGASSGLGHLTSFVGTDTVPAIDFAEEYYNANADKELIGTSVPATEHSVMCMGTKDGEFDTFKRLITEVYPKGIVSIVSDSFDFWQVITKFLPKLKEDILARKGGFPIDRVVIRPDSGDPVKIIVGDPQARRDSPEFKGAIQCLWDIFGGTVTDKGFRVLDSHIGLIYGDSITLERCEQIMSGLKDKGFASTNVVLGVGSYTYTYTTRDTLGFAMKATAGIVNGETREIFKDPKTDSGLKKSARGFILVVKDGNGDYIALDRQPRELVNSEFNQLKEVFRDGKLLVDQSLAEIRARVQANVEKALA